MDIPTRPNSVPVDLGLVAMQAYLEQRLARCPSRQGSSRKEPHSPGHHKHWCVFRIGALHNAVQRGELAKRRVPPVNWVWSGLVDDDVSGHSLEVLIGDKDARLAVRRVTGVLV